MEHLAQQGNQAGGVHGALGHVTPLVDAAVHRARLAAADGDPFQVGVHRTQPGQSRAMESAALQRAIRLAPVQPAGQACSGNGRHVLHSHVDDLIGSKRAPEAQQHDGPVARQLQQGRFIASFACRALLGLQPVGDLLQLIELQWSRLLLLGRVLRHNAPEHLAHQRCLGRVRKALFCMPTRERRQPLPQGADLVRARVGHEVASDGIAGGR